jgi:hypothetical protein
MPDNDDETGPPVGDQLPDESIGETTEDKPRRPAMVINVYSWATPVVGVLMLVLGLLGGYFGRPLITEEAEPAAVAGSSEVVPTPDPADDARRQEMMNFLVEKVTHFKGEESAPVTIIEFSDFQ